MLFQAIEADCGLLQLMGVLLVMITTREIAYAIIIGHHCATGPSKLSIPPPISPHLARESKRESVIGERNESAIFLGGAVKAWPISLLLMIPPPAIIYFPLFSAWTICPFSTSRPTRSESTTMATISPSSRRLLVLETSASLLDPRYLSDVTS